MLFAGLVDRVRIDFTAVPELEVTLPQAIRLWNLGADDCRYVVDALVDAGFLRWTAAGTIVRAGVRRAEGTAREKGTVAASVLVRRTGRAGA